MTSKTSLALLPYGEFNRAERATLRGDDPPLRFRALRARPGLSRPELWNSLFSKILAEINEVFWPNWDPGIGAWDASLSLSNIEELTRADHRLLDRLEHVSPARGLDSSIDSPFRKPDAYSHREMFLIEDDRARNDSVPKEEFASFYHMYDRNLDTHVASQVTRLFFRFMGPCLTNTSHRIKARLQRPRPYQTCLPMGFSSYNYEVGRTASTPSACSGHCLQGLVVVAAIFEFLKFDAREDLTEDNKICFQHFAVDIGDRRVFAGIHYPSDNLVSWLVALRLAPYIFLESGMQEWIWQAIKQCSRLHRAITEFSEEEGGAVYRKPLMRLEQAALAAPLELH